MLNVLVTLFVPKVTCLSWPWAYFTTANSAAFPLLGMKLHSAMDGSFLLLDIVFIH